MPAATGPHRGQNGEDWAGASAGPGRRGGLHQMGPVPVQPAMALSPMDVPSCPHITTATCSSRMSSKLHVITHVLGAVGPSGPGRMRRAVGCPWRSPPSVPRSLRHGRPCITCYSYCPRAVGRPDRNPLVRDRSEGICEGSMTPPRVADEHSGRGPCPWAHVAQTQETLWSSQGTAGPWEGWSPSCLSRPRCSPATAAPARGTFPLAGADVIAHPCV